MKRGLCDYFVTLGAPGHVRVGRTSKARRSAQTQALPREDEIGVAAADPIGVQRP
jgi:hypothetical protein